MLRQFVSDGSVVRQARYFILSAQLPDRLHVFNKGIFPERDKYQRPKDFTGDKIVVISIKVAELVVELLRECFQVRRKLSKFNEPLVVRKPFCWCYLRCHGELGELRFGKLLNGGPHCLFNLLADHMLAECGYEMLDAT